MSLTPFIPTVRDKTRRLPEKTRKTQDVSVKTKCWQKKKLKKSSKNRPRTEAKGKKMTELTRNTGQRTCGRDSLNVSDPIHLLRAGVMG